MRKRYYKRKRYLKRKRKGRKFATRRNVWKMFKKVVETKYRDLTIGNTTLVIQPANAPQVTALIANVIFNQGTQNNQIIGNDIFVRKIIFSLNFFRIARLGTNDVPLDCIRITIIRPYNPSYALNNLAAFYPTGIYVPWDPQVGHVMYDKRFQLADFSYFSNDPNLLSLTNGNKGSGACCRQWQKVFKINRKFMSNPGAGSNTNPIDKDIYMVVNTNVASQFAFIGNIRITYMDA